VTTRQGQTVNAAQSAPTIVTLGQLDRMTVDAEIAEADVIHVRPGMAVYFTILGDPDHRFTGRLRAIAPAPTAYVSAAGAIAAAASNSAAAAVYYNGVFDVDNPGRRLRTTMTANVSIILQEARQVLTIPAAAIGGASSDGSYRLRVLGKDRVVSSRAVRIGLNDGVRVQVLSGLSVGEQVVVGEQTPSAAKPAVPAAPRPRGMPRTVGGL
jgi:macrolide-specific efflux system membrane fusion protein